MTIKELGKRALGKLWRLSNLFRRPLVRRFHGALDAKVDRLEANLDANLNHLRATIVEELSAANVASMQQLLPEMNLLLRGILSELDHIEQRLDDLTLAGRTAQAPGA